jgi:pimeloyl-ACP methyl ester carboxylesterase
VTAAPRPLLLIHGAWHDAWAWHLLEPLLDEAGIAYLSLQLPLSSYEDDVAAVRVAALELARPAAAGSTGIVACGHSYGGRVLSTAALPPTPATHLVYIAAPAPDEQQISHYATAGRHRGEGIPDFESAWRTFYSGLEREQAQTAYRHLRPMPAGAGAVLGLENRPWREVDSTYVICGEDHALPTEVQRQMSQNFRHQVEIGCDHSPFLSAPTELAEILVSICRDGPPPDGAGG